jgi:ATP-dependent DNA helicase PIF1
MCFILIIFRFPTRNEVENSNRKRLQALKGESYHYAADDSGRAEGDMRAKLLANMMAPPTLELKKGAQVMLIKNMDETLVNGSLGTVEDFVTESSLALRDGDDSDNEMDKKKNRIRAFTNALESQKGSTTKYPLVRFHAVDGSSRELLCVPEDWKVELPTGEIQASRKQLPLILAWALSIHKAQGQTLERVKVDLGKVFEKGQAYVALSRATSQQGLQVLGFRKDKVMAHPRVISFYDQLYSAEQAVQKKAATSISSFLTKPPPLKSALATAQKSAGSHLMREKKTAAKERDEYGFGDDDEEAMAAYG